MLLQSYKFFSTSIPRLKIMPANLKGKKVSSQQWLSRQLNDPYVDKAKMLNYRCRSAFKLLEISEKFDILKPGYIVIDCGAAPGSWTQVAVNKVNTADHKGVVIAVDKQQFHPIEGATILGNSDFTQVETQNRIKAILDLKKADVVLSDMAPSATGIKEMDDENIINLCYSVLRFAVQNSKVDASVVVKLWQCNAMKNLQNDIGRFYENVKIVKPKACRSDSAELYLVGRCFKGLKNS